MKETEVNEEKRKLYLSLLKKDPEELSDHDTDLMFHLSKDPYIQEVINAHL